MFYSSKQDDLYIGMENMPCFILTKGKKSKLQTS